MDAVLPAFFFPFDRKSFLGQERFGQLEPFFPDLSDPRFATELVSLAPKNVRLLACKPSWDGRALILSRCKVRLHPYPL